MGLIDWLFGKSAGPRPYVRRESPDLIDRYDAPRQKFAELTPDAERLLQCFEAKSGLTRDLREFSVESERLREVAQSMESASVDSFGVPLGPTGTAEGFDRVFERSLCSAEGTPSPPLLYYGLGAAWGEWLRAHRGFEWHLFGPLDPIQAFDDLDAHAWMTFAPPFSHVTKKFMDPTRSSFAGRGAAELQRDMGPPPRALLASPADAPEAMSLILRPKILQAANSALPEKEALALLHEAASGPPLNPLEAFYIAEVAIRHRAWVLAADHLEAVLSVHEHPRHAFNLANALLEDEALESEVLAALDRALSLDPKHWRARLTKGSLLATTDRRSDGVEILELLLRDENCPYEIAVEAKAQLDELR
ncbi:MAG TPA: hypothetical protein VI643_00815 [Planctomycetota bacterium]|nr:hypothetical protein [Planctomycetota bacterium]